MRQKVEIELDGKKISIESGELAKQAGGAVIIQQGETQVFVSATAAGEPREGIDFFPLTVDFREKFYAAGRIPGGFFRREARPTDSEVLVSRLTDRSIRPMFEKGFKNETQVICYVVSYDEETPADTLALVGASAALTISDIPYHNPLAGVRVGRIEGNFVFNPNKEEIQQSDINLVMAGTEEGISMVEAGSEEVSEETMMEALEFGHERIKEIIKIQHQLKELLGKEKIQVEVEEADETLVQKVDDFLREKLHNAIQILGKKDRQNAMDQVKDEYKAHFNPDDDEELKDTLKTLFDKTEKDVVRKLILNTRKRIDGRNLDEVRPITCSVNYLNRTHGSAVFTRGETQALVTTTLGTGMDEQRMDTLAFRGTKAFMLHYNFPPFCTGEVKFLGNPGRREVGHGMLAERSLIPILPSKEEFPYTIRVVSEILESNGSSSMASVCGGTLSLMDAGVPIKAPVAGIAMGLIKDNDDTAVLSDILGSEDHLGDMDFKVAGTENGITALQMDIKITGLDKELMSKALQQAKEGRLHILSEMKKAIEQPRENLSKYAPRIVTIQINPEKIKDIIGPGGKVIREIIDKTGVTIDINDNGKVAIGSSNEEQAQSAINIIEGLVQEVEVGKIYLGRVKKIVDFGAFVEIFPGTDGLVHISQICDRRISKVSDEIQEDDEIKVKVIDIDRQGKVKLSRKEALKDSAVVQ